MKSLAKPTVDAARAYREHMNALITFVDRDLADDPARRALIGDNPLRMMFDNHRNQAQFVSSCITAPD